MNTQQIIGNLAADPILSKTKKGNSVLNFTVIDNIKDETGMTRPESFKCVLFGPLAKAMNETSKKGYKVYVDGETRTDSWEDDGGNRKYMKKVYVQNIHWFPGQKLSNEKNTH